MEFEKVTWPILPHTEKKHIILKRYLDAWIPIRSSKNGRIVFIDGFAGPGEYKNGEEGSPIIAMKSLIQHKLNLKGEFIFIFIEKEKDRCDHLKTVISRLERSPNPNLKLKFFVECGEFSKVVDTILNKIKEEQKRLAPTLLFIDPFGFSGIPLEIIKRFMANTGCEVLISFMVEDLIRWCELDQNLESIDALFGTDEWRVIRDKKVDSKEKLEFIVSLYIKKLKEEAGITFVRPFKMINQSNKTDYFLIFGTNNELGLQKMKESMWSVDPSGKFSFSDASYDPKQKLLFPIGPDYNFLKRLLIKEFKGKTVSIEEIESFVGNQTDFLITHLRKNILDPMEKNKEIEVFCSKKRNAGTYPRTCTKISFFN